MNYFPQGAFSLQNCHQQDSPVLLAVPHAARQYPDSLLTAIRIPTEKLVRLEDRYADFLITHAICSGHSAIIAAQPRALIDLNRDLCDLNLEVVTAGNLGALKAVGWKPGIPLGVKARGGLGLIPNRLTDCGGLWRRRFSAQDVADRISRIHAPYHAQIETLLAQRVRKHGSAVLLDVHSMPPISASGFTSQPDIVIGDLYGASADDIYVSACMDIIRDHGLRPALNNPYAGSYILRRHGRPRYGVHAIQVEVCRSLYLDAELQEPDLQGTQKMALLIAQLADALAALSGRIGFLEAAE